MAAPIMLSADSQLLFARDAAGERFLARVLPTRGSDGDPSELRAAYLGASNGDVPAFFDLFVAAMEGLGVRRCRHVPAEPSGEDLAFLDAADIVLLAGGDVERGLRAFERAGLFERLRARRAAGSALVGVSAGAVQLGRGCYGAVGAASAALGLVPYVVGVHAEPSWAELEATLRREGRGQGLGIPAGGGAIVRTDREVEPLRMPLALLRLEAGKITRARRPV